LITLAIGNSYSRIIGMNPKQERELREILSYSIDSKASYFSGYYGPKKKTLLTKRGEFPTGLLHRLPKWEMRIVDQRKQPTLQKPADFKFRPYEDQGLAANAAIDNHQGTISMPTGSGKSLVIALIASRLNVSTLVVVPTLEIKKQLTQSLTEALGTKHKVVVENIDSSRLLNLTSFDCLIIDEAHHSAAKTYQRLNKTAWTGIYYRFFLTATPFRNNSDENLLFEAIAGRLIYKLDYKRAVKNGYIVPVEAYYIEIPKQHTDAYTYQEVYKELVVNNKLRNDVLRRLLGSLLTVNKSTLCLVKEIQHGKHLEPFKFVSGEDESSRGLIQEFNNGDQKVLVGTEGIMSEGIDTRACEYVILAGLGRAKSRFMQAVGRCLRKYPYKETGKIILIRDSSHKYLLRHFREQCKVLKEEYNVIPQKLDI
jgi:DNA repair protein RadD